MCYDNTKTLASSSKIQETFLNHCRKERIQVNLVTNVDLSYKGLIAGFDQDCIVLEKDGAQRLFYKAALVAITPESDLNFIFNDAYRFKAAMKRYERKTMYDEEPMFKRCVEHPGIH